MSPTESSESESEVEVRRPRIPNSAAKPVLISDTDDESDSPDLDSICPICLGKLFETTLRGIVFRLLKSSSRISRQSGTWEAVSSVEVIFILTLRTIWIQCIYSLLQSLFSFLQVVPIHVHIHSVSNA